MARETVIEQLIKRIEVGSQVYIQPHNMPDPDGIASAFALKELFKLRNIEAEIIYVDFIEKANAKKMVEMLGISMTHKEQEDYEHDCIILVDSQQGNANITKLKAHQMAVIDHHRCVEENDYFFEDIRSDVGACSSILASYYKELGLFPSKAVATALVYAIMMDTDNLSRNNNTLDVDMFYWLYNQADFTVIKALRMNEIGKTDIKAYAKALENIEIYGQVGFIHIEDCNDSLLGTISDMVYTIEGVNIVVSYAKRSDGIKFSIRSGVDVIRADELARYLINGKGVGGGHDEMAGGFISRSDMDFLENKDINTYVRYRALSYVEDGLYRN